MQTLTLVAFIAYLLVVVSIALIAYRLTRNLSDYVLGGRQLGGPVAALSAGASDMSAWLLLGLPGAVYLNGINQLWLPVGLTLGAYLSWRIIAKPLRIFSEFANDSLTLPAFLDNRLQDQTGSVRVILAIVTLVFFAFYTASGLVAGAMLMQRFGLEYHTALILGACIIVAYTFVGGFLAVSWTDFFQGTFMFICLLAIPTIAIQELGGIETTLNMVKQVEAKRLDPFMDMHALLIVNLLAWGLGYFGQPHILVRFMAVKTYKDISIARKICVTWMSFSMVGAVLTGIVGFVYYLNQTIIPESIFIIFSQSLFSPWLSGILLAAIMSSVMCAIDSQMLASSSALTEDLYHRLLRPNAKPKELMWLGRIGILAVALVALSLAKDPDSRVIDLVAFAWAGLGASFGPVVIAALFYRKLSTVGAVMGVVLGASAVVVWKLTSGGIFDLYEIIPGFAFGLLGILVGSRLYPPSKATIELYDNAWVKINQH